MPQTDPLERIMGMLRNQGAVDPAQAQERMARMKPERRQSGAAPPEQRRETPVEGRPVRDRQSSEEGTEGDMTAPGTTIPVIVDALNESIIALKVEIHRTGDKEKRRELEGHARRLREQISSLGGEPVYADETVEEGLQKLGQRRMREEQPQPMGQEQQMMREQQMMQQQQMGQQQQPGMGMLAGLGLNKQQPELQTRGYVGADLMKDLGEQTGYTPGLTPDHPAYQTEERQRSGETATRPFLEHRGAEVGWDQEAGQVIARGPAGETMFTPSDIEGPGVSFAPQDELTRILQEIGLGEPSPVQPREAPEWDEFYDPTRVEAAPAPRFNEQSVNRIISEYGLQPRSEEEIAQAAEAMVKRQALGRKQAVQKQLDRFNREHPTEFDRAQEQIRKTAKEMSADRQEEISNRGMYYGSVLANAASSLDAAVMDEIGQIASEAASYVADLHRDLQDIEEWKAVEREALRHEMMAQEREHGTRIAQMRMGAMQHADQMALDMWATEQQLRLKDRDQQFEQFKFEVGRSLEEQGMAASASVMRQPMFQEYLEGMGMSLYEFERLPLPQQSVMAEQAPGIMEFEINRERGQLENRLIAEEVHIAETYGREQARLATRMAGLEVSEMELRVSDYRREVEAKAGTNFHRRIAGMTLQEMEQGLLMGSLQMDVTRQQMDVTEQQMQMGLLELDKMRTELKYYPEMLESELKMAELERDILEKDFEDVDDAEFWEMSEHRLSGAQELFVNTEKYVRNQDGDGIIPNFSMIHTELASAKRRAEEIKDPTEKRIALNDIREFENAVKGHPGYKEWTSRNDPEQIEEESRTFWDKIKDTFWKPSPEYWEDQWDFSGGDDALRVEGWQSGGQLTEHFHESEFADPATGEVKVDSRLVSRLEQMRQEIGRPINITSGYRSPEHNANLPGAATNSQHMYGKAADITVDGMSPREVAKIAEKYFGDGGIGVYSGHVHVDVGPRRRW